MNRLESALHALGHDDLGEPAPAHLADRVLARARQRSHRRGGLTVVGAATVAALIAVGVTVTATTAARPQRPALTPAATATAPALARPRTNVLLVGSDAAPDRIGVRPDTLLLASIDTRTGATTLFSLPRALEHVPFRPGTPQARAWPDGFSCADQACLLNSVWTWAENDGARYYPDASNQGLAATTEVIEQITGLSVDQTVVVNLQGLAQLVDAVGGVDVNVGERLPIGGNGDPTSRTYHQATGGWIEKGRQHLDGHQALWFARSRWSTNDHDRMGRQQCLIAALAGQLDARTLLTRYPTISKALGDNLITSIRTADLPAWADLASRMRDAGVQRVGLVPEDPADPDFAALRRQVAAVLAGRVKATTPTPAVGGAAGWVSEGGC